MTPTSVNTFAARPLWQVGLLLAALVGAIYVGTLARPAAHTPPPTVADDIVRMGCQTVQRNFLEAFAQCAVLSTDGALDALDACVSRVRRLRELHELACH
jgi:hypothetical protein